ncbi:Phosphatidic acid phosphatase type 2/haloperoxidase [Acididesulfobacillus acetoxydans]|uniref:Phosphatidic acid phosphatase type 2/haloperoxidase n=1 Tax=Acididesulfobacillus acetoxydans TaxID=1561005 RepID=A0A8S0Y0M0_9FIRM|nr:hypothetical protein [Acididesulfobacillus acetoxydans]CAA7603277.1 Phosphatidic acid phosphatase type 2/haloperoxidase [Acididesulfobacillus acetoxydans]
MNSFDLFGYHLINHWAGHHPVLDKMMAFLAQYALELYVVLFVLAWFTLPKSDSGKRHSLVVAGFSGVLALAFNAVIGHFFFRPRPFAVLPKGTFTQLIPHSLRPHKLKTGFQENLPVEVPQPRPAFQLAQRLPHLNPRTKYLFINRFQQRFPAA